MRYDPARGYQHPVIGQRDYYYRDGCTFETDLRIRDDATTTEFRCSVDFNCNVESIQECVAAGEAVCAAWVYCGSTSYRSLFKARTTCWELDIAILGDSLRKQIEIHPLILAVKELQLPVHDSHEAFGRDTMSLEVGSPLAVDKCWRIPVDMTPGSDPVDIFRLKPVDGPEAEALTGAWDLLPDEAGGITLIADTEVFEYFREQKSQQNAQRLGQECPISIAMGLGLPAFVEALTIYAMDNENENDENEYGNWRSTISRLLDSVGIEVNDGSFRKDGRSRSALWVAQLLLKNRNPLMPPQGAR